MYNILNFPIPNFWIFLSSKKLSTDVHNIINYITGYGSSKLSFTVDTFYEQIIQMNSPKKPNRVLINGTKIDEVSSISELNNGTWFYNSSEKKIYINVREVPQIRIGVYTSTSTFGEYSAETIAEEFNMSQSSRWVNSVKMNRVHELNPGYKALVYRNLKDIYNYSIDEWQLANSSGWLLKDINGNFIRSPTWPENYLVDITNPDYQQWVAAKVKSWLEEYPFFDGVMADNSIASDVREWLWDSPTKPINPRTGTYFTDQEIRNAYIQLHKEIKNAIGSKLLVCNGIWNGGRFFDRYNSYMEIISNSPLDVIVSEGLWNANNKYWYSEGDWLDSLNFMVWVQDNFLRNHPDRYFVAVDYSNENIIPGSDENQTALYGFASTLLGAKTNQNNLAVGWNWDADFLEFMDKLHKIEVGFPENDYYTIEGTHVYTRDFSKVKVLVNPTDYSYTINLDSSYKTLDGRIVSSITMINHTGEILLKT